MQVSIGMRLQEGPWGGGNQFGKALAESLRAEGVEVAFDLASPGLDLILLTEPRANLRISAYTDREILRYRRRNRNALVVHRVNECDERKSTREVNALLQQANQCADHTVFVSSWLREHFLQLGWPCASTSVILNGSDNTVFHSSGRRSWRPGEKMRLVTHHWGANWLKGFDIYQKLDQLLQEPPWAERVEFTYIGNLPPDFSFKNANYQAPLHGPELAAELRSHHVYLTASQFEPGGHHQNEGASCGLPLLYRESGCLPEYCAGFGLSFHTENFETRLEEMLQTYEKWVGRMPEFPRTAERMCRDYLELFKSLVERRQELVAARRKEPSWLRRLIFR